MNQYFFTIVTICKNAEKEIQRTIESVIQQDYNSYEYIIIDGNSTDRTNDIIENYREAIEAKCSSFKYISENDKGISDAFNKGIKLATGDIIGLINAGDTLLFGALQYLNAAFDEHIDIIYGNTVCVDRVYGLEYLRQKPENLDLSKIAQNGLVFTHQSAFVKKRLYDSIGLYDTDFKIIMDEELFIRFYKNGAKFKYIDVNLVSMLAGGVSSTPTKRIFSEHVEIGKRHGGVNKYALALKYIGNLPVLFLKKILKKNRKVWYFLIGKKRNIHVIQEGEK